MFKRLITVLFFLSMLLACSDTEKVTLEFRIAEDKTAANLTEIVFEPTGEIFYLHNEVLVNQNDVESSTVVEQQGRPAVELILTSEGTKKFKELTGQNVGKRCGMVLNGKLLSAPVIRDTVPSGRAIITGIFTKVEVEAIANGLMQQ